MPLSDYTSPEAVRSVLGVSDEELDDATIGLELHVAGLEYDLITVGGTAITAYATAVAAGDTGSQAEKDLVRAVRYFSAFATARHLATALPMFGLKDMTDGKASGSRFADSPYRAVLERMERQYSVARALLSGALSAFNQQPAKVSNYPRVFVIGTPAYDPVTGDGV